MKLKKTILVVISISLISIGISLPANAGKVTASFGGTCTQVTDQPGVTHSIKFFNVPNGTYRIRYQMVGQISYLGLDSNMGLLAPTYLYKPFGEQTIDLNALISSSAMPAVESLTSAIVSAQAFGHNGSAKSDIFDFTCVY